MKNLFTQKYSGTIVTLGAGLLLSMLICAAASAATRTVRLPHGQGTIHVRGYLHGYNDQADFVLYARRGQHLSLEAGGVVTLIYPDGHTDGAPGGISDVLPTTGKYRITVAEHRMAEPYNGPFTLTVRLHQPRKMKT